MICNSLKECVEGTRHIVPKEKKTGRKGKKKDAACKRIDIYQQPLCQSPCRSEEQQKRCIEYIDCRSRATCTENGKRYTLDQSQEYPRHEIVKLHIDGGVISNPEASTVMKCDYVILIKEGIGTAGKRNTAILVELKGKDVHHALEQIMAALHQTEFVPVWESCARVYGRIVCKSSVPRIWSTENFITAKEAFLKRGGNLGLKEEEYSEEYRNL